MKLFPECAANRAKFEKQVILHGRPGKFIMWNEEGCPLLRADAVHLIQKFKEKHVDGTSNISLLKELELAQRS